jgi:hypothetical protein
MIVIEKFLCIRSTLNPEKIHYIKQDVKKFSNNMKFDGDLFSSKDVFNFLCNYKNKNGKKLERETIYGEPYVYNMFVRGRSREMPFKIAKNGRPAPYYNLFPGYDKKDNRLDLYPTGLLN